MSSSQITDTPQQDNLFGVCAALGEDFGFNPLWLRIALAVGFLFRPELVAAGYFAVGAAVLVSRLIYPAAKPKAVSTVLESAVEMNDRDTSVQLARAA